MKITPPDSNLRLPRGMHRLNRGASEEQMSIPSRRNSDRRGAGGNARRSCRRWRRTRRRTRCPAQVSRSDLHAFRCRGHEWRNIGHRDGVDALGAAVCDRRARAGPSPCRRVEDDVLGLIELAREDQAAFDRNGGGRNHAVAAHRWIAGRIHQQQTRVRVRRCRFGQQRRLRSA